MKAQTLQRQFRIWTVLLVIVPSLLIMAIYTVGQIKAAKLQSQELISQRVSSQERLIEYWVTERLNDVRNLSQAEAFRSLDEQRMKRTLDLTQQANKNFDSLSYIDKDGYFKLSTLSGGIQFPSAVGRPYFQTAMAGQEFISDVVVGRNSGLPIINFSCPVYDDAGNVQGLILGSVRLTMLEILLQNNWIGETGEVFIVNKDGTMLTEPRYVNVLLAKGLVADTARMKFKITTDAFHNIRLGETGTATWIDYLGDKVLGAYHAMPERGWTVIGKIKEAEVLAPIYHQLAIMTGGTIVLLLIMLPLAALITNRIKRPIDWLIGQSNLVAVEEYEKVGREKCGEKMPHELGNLCETFVAMSRKIEKTVGLLKDNEAKLESKVVEIQDVNATLEEEIMERHAAQEALRQLNTELETRVCERTAELQDLNATLEEEIMERHAAQEALSQLNTELEDKVRQRTSELQEINATLEEEISERQSAQEALYKTNDALIISQSRYRALFEHMQNTFVLRKVILDEEGRPVDLEYLEVNPAFEAFVGHKADDIVGKRLTEIYPGITEEPFDWIQELGGVALTGQPKTFEQYYGFSCGWYQFSAYSPERGLVALLATDITERKHAEECQRRYAEEVAATNRELQSFTNIVAHDFRSPMVNLKGFSKELGGYLSELKHIIHDEIVQSPHKAPQKLNEILEKDVPEALKFIYSSVDRLDRMINTLLKLAREGRREMIYKEVDCTEIVNVVLRSFEHQITQKSIQVAVGPLPTIESDRLAFEQIVSNLLDNSIKYLEPGRTGNIAISCTNKGNEYLFSVEDNGRGVAPGDCEKIFELFRRVGKEDVPGEGMGLAYVRTLVRQLGGKIWCVSELGTGTTMFFTVPRIPGAFDSSR